MSTGIVAETRGAYWSCIYCIYDMDIDICIYSNGSSIAARTCGFHQASTHGIYTAVPPPWDSLVTFDDTLTVLVPFPFHVANMYIYIFN